MTLPGLMSKLSFPNNEDTNDQQDKTVEASGKPTGHKAAHFEETASKARRTTSESRPPSRPDASHARQNSSSSNGSSLGSRKRTSMDDDDGSVLKRSESSESSSSAKLFEDPVSMNDSDEERLHRTQTRELEAARAHDAARLRQQDNSETVQSFRNMDNDHEDAENGAGRDTFKEPKPPASQQDQAPRLSVDLGQTKKAPPQHGTNPSFSVTPATPVDGSTISTPKRARGSPERPSLRTDRGSHQLSRTSSDLAAVNSDMSSFNHPEMPANVTSCQEVSMEDKDKARAEYHAKPQTSIRHILRRLPSQAVTDSPSSEAPSTPVASSSGGSTPWRPASDQRGQVQSPVSEDIEALSPKTKNEKSSDYRFPHTQPNRQDSLVEGTSQDSSMLLSPLRRTQSPPDTSDSVDLGRLRSPRLTPHSRNHSTSSSTGSINEFSTPDGFRHRRSSSQGIPREVKETLGAGYEDLPDGKRKLNQYILTHDIGRGSFGVVTKAKDEETGQEYAVKEFSKMRLRKRAQSEMVRRQGRGARRGAAAMRGAGPDRTRSMSGDSNDGTVTPNTQLKNDLELIRSEVAVMKKVDHPNCVRLYEVLDVQEDDSLFMVVELCANGPLMSVTMGEDAEPMTEEMARNYFRQIVLAIEYLHYNGIIHRDIKPENILRMANADEIKLVDFGVSEMFDKSSVDDPRELKAGGSPAFMSPELCISHAGRVSGKAADIWALGVTLYCMVVGHLPFESKQMLELYDKIKTEPVKIPKELSTELKDVLAKLLEKDPSQRIKMDDLRDHAWLTVNGADILPTKEVNVSSLAEVTAHDVEQAIATPSVSYIVNAVRAASRWRRLVARRTQSDQTSDSATDNSGIASRDMSRAGSHDPNNSSLSRTESPITSKASKSSSLDSMSKKDGVSATADVARNKATDVARTKSDPPHCTTAAISLQKASSFPESTTQSDKDSATPASKTAFPQVSSRQSHLEHLSGGIDDCNVETLRFYEDSTGHDFPRNAVIEAASRSPQT